MSELPDRLRQETDFQMVMASDGDNSIVVMSEQERREEAALRIEELIKELEAENARLQQWKQEAMSVLAEWDRIYEALGLPGVLGESKARAATKRAEQLMEGDQ